MAVLKTMKLLKQSHNLHAPLDALVVSRLAALRHAENELRQRYDGLVAKPTADGSNGWAVDVWKLQLQTDRLERMLDALGGDYASDPREKSTLAAA